MFKPSIFAAMLFLTAATAATTVHASYDGPHNVFRLNGNEFAVMVTGSRSSPTLRAFRAMGGSSWQYVGASQIQAGQRTSNGSLVQNIYFNGRRVRRVTGDLRKPFYRLFPNIGRNGGN